MTDRAAPSEAEARSDNYQDCGDCVEEDDGGIVFCAYHQLYRRRRSLKSPHDVIIEHYVGCGGPNGSWQPGPMRKCRTHICISAVKREPLLRLLA